MKHENISSKVFGIIYFRAVSESPVNLPLCPKMSTHGAGERPTRIYLADSYRITYIYSYRLTGKNFSVPRKSRPQTQ